MMTNAVFEAKWKQMRNQVRRWWSELSDSDVDQIAGRYGRLMSVLREKYSYTGPRAEQEIDRHMAPAATRAWEASR
jgi:uncharacterized protein YjbJ (UPF0337 family)